MNREVKQIILHRIANGTLSREETEKRLRALVDEELDKPADEMNTELIQESTRLLQEMYGGKAVDYNSQMARSGERIRENLLAKARKRERRIQTWRTAAGIAAVLVLMIVLPKAGYGTWKLFHKSDLTTHNAYVITGLSGAGTFPNPSKIKTDTSESIYAKTYEEVVEFLGYAPYNPTEVFSGWTPVEYCADVSNIGIHFFIGFRCDEKPTKFLLYESVYYFLMDDVDSNLQFNGEETISYLKNNEVAYMQNMDMNSCMWESGNIVYKIAGSIDLDTLERCVLEIIGGKESW